MPGSYTPSAAGTLTSRTWAALSNMLVGTDAPNAANVTAALKSTIDMVATILAHGGLLAVAGTWTALQTFGAGIVVPDPVIHHVGAVGEPAYGSGWAGNGTTSGSWFYLHTDGSVTVHVDAHATGVTGTTSLAFTLPVGFRPAHTVISPGLVSDDMPAFFVISASGDVSFMRTSSGAFNGCLASVTFHPNV